MDNRNGPSNAGLHGACQRAARVRRRCVIRDRPGSCEDGRGLGGNCGAAGNPGGSASRAFEPGTHATLSGRRDRLAGGRSEMAPDARQRTARAGRKFNLIRSPALRLAEAGGGPGMMRHLILVAVFLGAMSTASAGTPVGWRFDGKSRSLVHTDSGLAFPPHRNGMTRTSPTTYDARGLDVSIGYNSTENELALTFYIYPSELGGDPDPNVQFQAAVKAALLLHPGATMESAVRQELPLGGSTAAGFNAFLHWSEHSREFGSFVVVIPQQERILKVRVTFEMDRDPEAIRKAADCLHGFLRSLKLPSRSGSHSS